MSSASSEHTVDAQPVKERSALPWSAWTGVSYVIGVFIFSQLISSVVLAAYASLRGLSGDRADAWFDSTGVQFAYYALTTVFVLSAVYAFLRVHKSSFSIIGLRKPRWSDLGWGLAAAPVYLVLYVIIVTVVSAFVPGLNVEQEQQLGFDNVVGTAALAMTFVSLVLLPPLIEEIMVRGLLYGSLKKALPIAVAVIVTSILFAAAHLPAGGAEGPLYIAAIDTFALSLVLIYLREKTGGLWASMTLHAAKNSVAFTILFIIR